MIPLINLKKQHSFLKNKLNSGFNEILLSNNYLNHDSISEFENKFATMHQCKYAALTSSGTTALTLILLSLKIGEKHEVITTPNTFFSTAESIIHTGAKPVFVDIDKNSLNIDVSKIENMITSKTKAIVPVHIYGNPCKLDDIKKICKKYKLFLIEDCAQSHLSSYKNKMTGSFGTASCFSFYPGKNLGALGDAGIICSNQKKLISKIKKLRNHGRKSKYIHNIVGYNFRPDSIQAKFLSIKLNYLSEWTDERIKKANIYKQNLSKISQIKFVEILPNAKHVYHLFVIVLKSKNLRDSLIKFLNNNGVSSLIHYPIPCHKQPALRHYNYKKLPISENMSTRILSLPLCQYTSIKNIKRVCYLVKKFLNV